MDSKSVRFTNSCAALTKYIQITSHTYSLLDKKKIIILLDIMSYRITGYFISKGHNGIIILTKELILTLWMHIPP